MSKIKDKGVRPRIRTNLGHKFLRLTSKYRGYPVGTVIQPPAAAAEVLMARGLAEEVEEPVVEEAPVETIDTPDEPPKRRRGRPPKNPDA